jgi:hypothetical protein
LWPPARGPADPILLRPVFTLPSECPPSARACNRRFYQKRRLIATAAATFFYRFYRN